jgi:glycosyltransferase involved in cell wall biosynthesis
MNAQIHHISVCICTYKRPHLLKRLLEELGRQETEGLFTYDIVVADNDRLQTAKPTVDQFAAILPIKIIYCVQPLQNISLARNKALEYAKGDYIAFFDDDQFPIPDWLLILYKTCKSYRVDGVLGPVKPYFEEQPPQWVITGGFCERATYETGFVIDWRQGRTGNVLLRRHLFDGLDVAFKPEFLTGEDQDFFRRMIEKGRVFVWCNEAVAYEIIPPNRWKRSFMLKRALLRGKISLVHPTAGSLEVLKSAIAIPAYLITLPFLLLVGQHIFMKYLVKTFDHAGRLLAFVGVDPIKDKYVTQ